MSELLGLHEKIDSLRAENAKLLAACKAVRYGEHFENAGSLTDPFTYFWTAAWNRLKQQLDEAIAEAETGSENAKLLAACKDAVAALRRAQEEGGGTGYAELADIHRLAARQR